MLARFTIRRTWEEVLELYDGLRQRWEDVVLPGLRAHGIKVCGLWDLDCGGREVLE